jgi:hypothetical protein
MPSSGKTMPNGTLNGRGILGLAIRIATTPPQTSTNANNVPIFTSSASIMLAAFGYEEMTLPKLDARPARREAQP